MGRYDKNKLVCLSRSFVVTSSMISPKMLQCMAFPTRSMNL